METLVSGPEVETPHAPVLSQPLRLRFDLLGLQALDSDTPQPRTPVAAPNTNLRISTYPPNVRCDTPCTGGLAHSAQLCRAAAPRTVPSIRFGEPLRYAAALVRGAAPLGRRLYS